MKIYNEYGDYNIYDCIEDDTEQTVGNTCPYCLEPVFKGKYRIHNINKCKKQKDNENINHPR